MKSGRRGWERKAGSEENRLRKISAKNGAISAEDSVFFHVRPWEFSRCSLSLFHALSIAALTKNVNGNAACGVRGV